MNESLLPNDFVERMLDRLDPVRPQPLAEHLQPVHVMYGGADLFKPDTFEKLRMRALRIMEQHVGDEDSFDAVFATGALTADVYAKTLDKLRSEPIEDYRIDFEDGFGIRPDEEEDAAARSAASALSELVASGNAVRLTGIRPKAFNAATLERGLRTLEIFVSTLHAGLGRLPEGFVITLPKVASPVEPVILADALNEIEDRLGIERGSTPVELMFETPEFQAAPDGVLAFRRMVDACGGRCRGVHFGAYDLLASLGVSAESQRLDHPSCVAARAAMLTSLAGTGVWQSDGATTEMPVGRHRKADLTEAETAENRADVAKALRAHYLNCRRSLDEGFYQSWDLHPGQLIARYAAVQTFFIEGRDRSAARLRNFIDRGTRATMTGSTFDDAATGQGLLNFFRRGIRCGAFTSEEATGLTSVTAEEFAAGSFAHILARRA